MQQGRFQGDAFSGKKAKKYKDQPLARTPLGQEDEQPLKFNDKTKVEVLPYRVPQ